MLSDLAVEQGQILENEEIGVDSNQERKLILSVISFKYAAIQ